MGVMKIHQCYVNISVKERNIAEKALKCPKVINEGFKTHKCETCGKTFLTSRKLGNHRYQVHEGEHIFPCDLCDKKFTLKHNLKNHVQTAHEGKTFPCEICEKLFKNNSSKLNHIRAIHGQKKSFTLEKIEIKIHETIYANKMIDTQCSNSQAQSSTILHILAAIKK